MVNFGQTLDKYLIIWYNVIKKARVTERNPKPNKAQGNTPKATRQTRHKDGDDEGRPERERGRAKPEAQDQATEREPETAQTTKAAVPDAAGKE